jgi:lysine 2,3-aminomutase
MNQLRGYTSGLAIPHFVIDAPGGGGKIPLIPNYVLHRDEDRIVLRNYKNEVYVYREIKERKMEEDKNKVKIDVGKNNGNGKVKAPKKFKRIAEIQTPELAASNN